MTRPAPPGALTSVLVVEDALVARKLVRESIDDDPYLRVVATAATGEIALAKIEQLQPDIVTLDLDLPGISGFEVLRQLRSRWPDIAVVIVSAYTQRGAAATLDALAMGARDYVTKPSAALSPDEALRELRTQLLPKIRALRPAGRAGVVPASATPALAPDPLLPRAVPSRVELVVIGTSTGGPEALTRLLPKLPADLRVPVLVVQHMPAMFTTYLARRLDGLCALDVQEAIGGEALRPGTVRLAPGDFHLTVQRSQDRLITRLDQSPPVRFCRPSVDVLFSSAARSCGAATLALVCTGMGTDGTDGAKLVREAGGQVLAQDEATSVVWGMPGSVARQQLADVVLPLDELAAELTRRVGAQ